MKKPP